VLPTTRCFHHISILSNARGAWPMFWPVLRRCHILRWDGLCCHWRIKPFFLSRSFGACWLLYVSTILWLTHRDCRIFIVFACCSECVHTFSGPRFIVSSEGRVDVDVLYIFLSRLVLADMYSVQCLIVDRAFVTVCLMPTTLDAFCAWVDRGLSAGPGRHGEVGAVWS
jgi:hypothetical protein